MEDCSLVESLIRMSKDPLNGLKPFVDLLSKTSADLEKADQEINTRLQTAIGDGNDETIEEYKAEKDKLKECKSMLEEVKE